MFQLAIVCSIDFCPKLQPGRSKPAAKRQETNKSSGRESGVEDREGDIDDRDGDINDQEGDIDDREIDIYDASGIA